jgi:hypothetical protein
MLRTDDYNIVCTQLAQLSLDNEDRRLFLILLVPLSKTLARA